MQLDVECDDRSTVMVNASIYKQSLGLKLIYTLYFLLLFSCVYVIVFIFQFLVS